MAAIVVISKVPLEPIVLKHGLSLRYFRLQIYSRSHNHPGSRIEQLSWRPSLPVLMYFKYSSGIIITDFLPRSLVWVNIIYTGIFSPPSFNVLK